MKQSISTQREITKTQKKRVVELRKDSSGMLAKTARNHKPSEIVIEEARLSFQKKTDVKLSKPVIILRSKSAIKEMDKTHSQKTIKLKQTNKIKKK